MNRTVKFRVWNKEKAFMHTCDGYYYEHYYYDEDKGICYYHESYEDDTYELMEYTGLKDCKGRDIYEGDIIRDDNSYRKGKVIFENGAFVIDYGKHIDKTLLRDCNSEVKVIGNIYEGNIYEVPYPFGFTE